MGRTHSLPGARPPWLVATQPRGAERGWRPSAGSCSCLQWLVLGLEPGPHLCPEAGFVENGSKKQRQKEEDCAVGLARLARLAWEDSGWLTPEGLRPASVGGREGLWRRLAGPGWPGSPLQGLSPGAPLGPPLWSQALCLWLHRRTLTWKADLVSCRHVWGDVVS